MKLKKGAQSLALGAAILLASNFIVKIIGALFQILMVNLIGNEVMGLYAAAFKVYAFFFIITTTGLPIAVSRMVAAASSLGKSEAVRRIMRVSMYLFVGLGLFFTGVMFVFAEGIASIISMPAAVPAIRVIAPSVVLICIISGFRGYFQGLRNMTPTGVSQIIEVSFKLLIGFGLGFYAKSKGLDAGEVAAYVISGITVGVIFSAIYMYVAYKKTELQGEKIKGFETKDSKILTKIFAIGIPITITAVIINSTGIIDMIVINNMLAAHMPEPSVMKYYSWYVNIAETLSTLPSSIIVGIGISVLPAITHWVVREKFDRARRSVRAAFRITAVLAFPCAVGISTLGRPIIMLLFKNYAETAETFSGTSLVAINATMPSLVLLCAAAAATCLYTTTTSVMQSCGLQNKTIISAVIAVSVKLVTTIGLMLIPGVGPAGAAAGTALCFTTATVSNMRYLNEFFGKPIGALKISVKPLFASAVCGLSAWAAYELIYFVMPSNSFALIIAILIAVVIYMVTIIFTKTIPPHEIRMLPKGERVYSALVKLGAYGKQSLTRKERD